LGQKQTLAGVGLMSALPPIADIAEGNRHVRFVPKADKVRRSKQGPFSITGQNRTHYPAIGTVLF